MYCALHNNNIVRKVLILLQHYEMWVAAMLKLLQQVFFNETLRPHRATVRVTVRVTEWPSDRANDRASDREQPRSSVTV